MRSVGLRFLLLATLMLAMLATGFGGAEQASSADLPGIRSAPLAATTLLVCKSGCTGSYYPSITAAVAAASSGDVIHVAEGTYNETVLVQNKSLTILGGYSKNWSGRDPATYVTIIQAASGKAAVKLVSDGGNNTGTVDGFTVTGGNNTAGQGGGFYVSGYRATISNNRIHHNHAKYGGGISVRNATGVTIESNVIEDNTSALDAGGIRVESSTVSIVGNTIRNNTATENGGGINVIGGTVTIDDNTIGGNVSQQKGGGGIMLRSNCHFDITNNGIRGNRAVVGGGGVRIEDSEGTVEGNEFKSNTSSNTGGGLAVVRSQVDVDDNDFSLNKGAGGGGMQVSQGSTGLISSNRLVDNEAGVNPGGGGIHIWQCSPQFVGNTVTDNTAGNAGGGVNIEDSSPLVQDNVITNNHAGDHGGGISMSVDSGPTIVGNLIADNTCSVKGGGIFGYDSAPLIRRNEIVDNQAPTAGGIHLTGSDGFEVTNNIIARNRATIEGGGIHLTSNSHGNIINNTLVDNDLGAGGEAINCRNTCWPTIANNILAGHTYGVRVKDQAAPTVEYNDAWDNNTNYEGVGGNPGHISCDPQFVDRAGGDYHLSAGSCVIDNGTQSGAPSSDFDGDARPLDGDGDGNPSWDRGADEYFNQVWVTKDVDKQVLEPGDLVTFTIVYRNNSASTVTGVVIDDILSDDLTNVSYDSTGPGVTPRGGSNPEYIWDVHDLSPGAEGTITINARVDPGIGTPKAITNQVTFQMNGYGPFEDEVLIIVGGLTTHAPAVLNDCAQ